MVLAEGSDLMAVTTFGRTVVNRSRAGCQAKGGFRFSSLWGRGRGRSSSRLGAVRDEEEDANRQECELRGNGSWKAV